VSRVGINLLIAGGRGFIGRHIVRHALDRGWQVTTLGRSPASDQLPSSVLQIAVDITDRAALSRAIGGYSFDYVINCGGLIDHRPFSQGGADIFDAHFKGVMNLVAALDRDALRRFVNIGSSDEYGGASAPQGESLREAPISPYSLGKTCAAHFLQALYRTERFPAAVVRLFLAYGPGQDHSRFLPQIIRGCLAGDEFAASEGAQLRDFCFIDDVVDAVFRTLERPAVCGEVINVASGRPISIREVIELIRKIAGAGTPHYGKVPYRPGENMALYADVSKASLLLDWSANTALIDGLTKTIRWIAKEK
jgi:nucleoside-diphosphate-sugar epimerase